MSLVTLGIYDLRQEGKKWVKENIGEAYVDEFEKNYDSLNRGIPIGGMQETIVFLDLVAKVRLECESKNIFKRISKYIRGLV